MRFISKAALGLLLALLAFGSIESPTPPSINYGPDYPTRLSQKHNCWTSGKHEIPGHVVAERPNDLYAKYYGSKVTGEALKQIDGGPETLTVYSFCK